jgi:5-dehydro-2-deoxygluconokinase
MGRFIREQLEREGVDVRGVRFDEDRLTALVILGIRDRETFPLIFYREDCADMALQPADIDAAWAAGAGSVLVNGTHLSRDNVFDTSVAAARMARAAAGRVVFDIDYRPVLWGLTGRDMGENRFVAHGGVTSRLQQVLPLCDLIVGTEEEWHILGGTTDTVGALRTVRALTDALLVCKRGPHGCAAFPSAVPERLDQGIVGRGFTVEVFNVLGAGDAFMAGFLRGWLRDEPIERCCEYANACGAIVVSRHGCAPAMPTWPELESFLVRADLPYRLRDDAALEQLHWATTRSPDYEELMVFAVDHRSQFEELLKELPSRGGSDDQRISDFKALALRALDRVAQGDSRFGILLDGRYGFDALADAADYPYWVGRPIELPRSRPLEFESSPDVAAEIAQWPLRHVVKCLAFYHPDDDPDLRDRQERQLLRLFDACRSTRHELLIEIILPEGIAADDTTVARALARLYEAGIRPDWWKLEPTQSTAGWTAIQDVIASNDPFCRGVLLLGLSAPIADLIESFREAAPVGIIKGFAVGRTIFYDVARAWMGGDVDDEGAVAEMASRLDMLVEAWRSERSKVEEAA